MSIKISFHVIAGILGIVAAICLAIPSRNRAIFFIIFSLVALIFEIAIPFLKTPDKEVPELDYSITYLPSNYSPGVEIYGVKWEKDFEEYQIYFRNKSKTTDIHDLRADIDLLGGIVKYQILSQQGCENLIIIPYDTEGGGIGVKNGPIVKTVKSYSNNLKINASKIFPEGNFQLRLIMKIISPIPKDKEISGFFGITYRYQTSDEEMKKKSFACKIFPKEAGSKYLVIDKENPISGRHTRSIGITFDKPLNFKKDGSVEVEESTISEPGKNQDAREKALDKEMKNFEAVKKATVAIALVDFNNKTKPYEIIGSGFCVDPAGVIVTCRHVIEAFMSKSIAIQIEESNQDPDNINREKKICKPGPVMRSFAIFYDTERSSTKLIAIPTVVDMVMAKTDKDIALLRVLKHDYFKNGYPFLEIADYKNIKEGQEIAVCGFPLGTYLNEQLGTMTSSFTKGIISSIIPSPGIDISLLKGFQLDITAAHGNSGGPAFFIDSGKVFGVLTQGIQQLDGKLLPGLVKAEPVYAVSDEIENIKTATIDSMLTPRENTGQASLE